MFAAALLPPTRVRYTNSAKVPGSPFWSYAESPLVVPWRATHRIHFIGPDRQPGTADVMWVLSQDQTTTWDMYLRRLVWYGYERDQWRPGGSTGWAFYRDQEYDSVPHRLRRTDSWQGDRASLGMERIGDGHGVLTSGTQRRSNEAASNR